MGFARRDDDGEWIEIGTTFEIDGVSYNNDWIAKETADTLAEVGIFFINDEETGVLGMRGQRSLVDIDGLPFWRYEIIPISAADLNNPTEDIRLQKERIEKHIEAAFGVGFQPNHPDFTGERLQCRDDTDRTNWLVAEREYSKAVERGQGDYAGARFRTQSNKTIVVSFKDAVKILEEMTAWAFVITERGWALKDALSKGEPYDINEGWPALPSVVYLVNTKDPRV